MKLLVTGGAGFIGSAVVRRAITERGWSVVNLDALTYAANLDNLKDVAANPAYVFEHADVRDRSALDRVFAAHRPDAVMHLAAATHVDRSIDGPAAFVDANMVGTFTLLEAARAHRDTLEGAARDRFRLHHVSTDEVYGALGAEGRFTEETPYRPNSPYAASKAGADMLARAWGRTYGMPVVISNCSNNYGPCQFPEKLIPVVILNAIEGRPIEIYGDGRHVRDWLYVEDHAEALLTILERGRAGETYNVGGDAEAANVDLVRALCAILDEMRPGAAPYERLITFVADRPGHDFRYAVDASKLKAELGWAASMSLTQGLRATAAWYLENDWWWRAIRERGFSGARLGLQADAAP